MKLHKLILSVAATTLLFTGCYDEKMEWGKPADHGDVNLSDLPLSLQEQIANYDFIKAYIPRANFQIGVGMGMPLYVDDETYRQVVNDNFNSVTLGNAMKQSSILNSRGEMNFAAVDNFIQMLPADISLYGHNLIWHTQQAAGYLNGLIAPEFVPDGSPDKMANILENSDFETGSISPWFGWSGGSTREISAQGEGYDSDYAMVLTNNADADTYTEQVVYDLPLPLTVGETYMWSMMIKADVANPQFQVQVQQPSGSYPGEGYLETATVPGTWILFEGEFQCTLENMTRLCISFGRTAGTYYVDDVKFGIKQDLPTEVNYLANGSFENDLEGWTVNNPGAGVSTTDEVQAVDGTKVLKATAAANAANAWDLQILSPTIPALQGKARLSFMIRSDVPGQGRVSFPSGISNGYPWMNWTGAQSGWTEAFETSTTWTEINVILQDFSAEFTGTDWTFALDLGYLPDVTYYVDNVKVTDVEEAAPAELARPIVANAFIEKSDEEKKALITQAMETWIKGMVGHFKERVHAWDVLNEPIADNGTLRGVEGGLPTDMDNDDFYYGFYMGKEYGALAFKWAREADPTALLFINDYNLEYSPGKLGKLIDYVNYIDANGGKVDGIGTQMHIGITTDKASITKMFQTLAATGKLIRVTELDITIGSASPSAEQLAQQADMYQFVVEQYLALIPTSQQSGITIWSLTDSKTEHEYWLPNDAPNLFNATYGRKHAYKGVCDALAGRDIGAEFTGDDWKTGVE
jgi:GH35 family endo-1,4-beta-xylanase